MPPPPPSPNSAMLKMTSSFISAVTLLHTIIANNKASTNVPTTPTPSFKSLVETTAMTSM